MEHATFILETTSTRSKRFAIFSRNAGKWRFSFRIFFGLFFQCDSDKTLCLQFVDLSFYISSWPVAAFAWVFPFPILEDAESPSNFYNLWRNTASNSVLCRSCSRGSCLFILLLFSSVLFFERPCCSVSLLFAFSFGDLFLPSLPFTSFSLLLFGSFLFLSLEFGSFSSRSFRFPCLLEFVFLPSRDISFRPPPFWT